MPSFHQGKGQRGHCKMVPHLFVLFTLAANVYCEDGESYRTDPTTIIAEGSTDFESLGTTEAGSVEDTSTTDFPDEDDELSLYIIIVPVLLLLLIVMSLIAIVIWKWKKNKNIAYDKEDKYLSGCNAEKIPSPMFEDDVPSVLELEMEDLEKWMIKKDSKDEDLESGKETNMDSRDQ
ncbi:transmembrane protein 154 [Amia ocellicauda]|uniref:transmembrane protein 154 n=1 Tax=Amia ocellicauda TaxID=2972642 RepID=UPI00346441E9